MAQLFFILGQGPSATGLLAQLLSRHSRVAIAPDSLFVLDLHRKYGAGGWNKKRVDAFCRDLGRLLTMSAWRLDTQRLASRLYERQSRLTYPEVCRQVYTSYAQDSLHRSSTRWVGEQHPQYALQIERLDALLPAARYVHVTRDYRAEIFDRMQSSQPRHDGPFRRSRPRPRVERLWSWVAQRASFPHPAAVAQRWNEYNRRILELSRHAPERTLWLRHEDLLAYPDHELTRVCRFLDLSFEPGLLVEPLAWPAARAEASTLPSTRSGHWQQLPEPTLRQAEAICGEFAERFGYRASSHARSSVSLPARLFTWCGAGSVAAERLAIRVVPAVWREQLSGAYDRIASSLPGRELSSEASPLSRDGSR